MSDPGIYVDLQGWPERNFYFNPDWILFWQDPRQVHTQKSRAATDDKKLKLKRLTIDLTAQEHRVLKSRAATSGLTMRDLVLQTLRQEGLLGRLKRAGRRSSAGPNEPGPDEADPSAEAANE